MSTRPSILGPDVSPEDLEPYRRELTAYCYRMLGSGFEAEDAVQEAMVKAWKAADTFEGRSALRSWLYRIATNVCFDMLRGRERRARPMELSPAGSVDTFDGSQLPESRWVSPIADARVLPLEGDPAELAEARESIRLAFITALQHLPARQRAVLILCEVLKWQATEVADLLETSVASVNSALQRARATLAARPEAAPSPSTDEAQQELLGRFVDAFERYDIDQLVTLLHDDVVQSMPPFEHWLIGAEEVAKFMLGPGAACRGSRLLPISANGQAGFAQYRPDPAGGWKPWSIHLPDIEDGKVVRLNYFIDTRLFEALGLPAEL